MFSRNIQGLPVVCALSHLSHLHTGSCPAQRAAWTVISPECKRQWCSGTRPSGSHRIRQCRRHLFFALSLTTACQQLCMNVCLPCKISQPSFRQELRQLAQAP